jgi:hypothetical protein
MSESQIESPTEPVAEHTSARFCSISSVWQSVKQMKRQQLLAIFAAALVALMFGASLFSATQAQDVAPPQLLPEEALSLAIERGDVEAMRGFQGHELRVQGRQSIVLRDTHVYRDIVLFTGRDFRLAGGQTGLEVIVRVPAGLAVTTEPPIMDVTGVITDFEPRVRGERLVWSPVITVSFLR